MKTSFKMVAMLLGIGVFPVCAQAQKKIVIEDEEPNSIMFVSRDKAGDEIIRIMNDRSQMRFHDPNAPRFLLTDQKENSPSVSVATFVLRESMTLMESLTMWISIRH